MNLSKAFICYFSFGRIKSIAYSVLRRNVVKYALFNSSLTIRYPINHITLSTSYTLNIDFFFALCSINSRIIIFCLMLYIFHSPYNFSLSETLIISLRLLTFLFISSISDERECSRHNISNWSLGSYFT